MKPLTPSSESPEGESETSESQDRVIFQCRCKSTPHLIPLNLQKFRAHKIDGSALLQLTESHLVDVMKLSLGPVVKLTSAVADKIRYLSLFPWLWQ